MDSRLRGNDGCRAGMTVKDENRHRVLIAFPHLITQATQDELSPKYPLCVSAPLRLCAFALKPELNPLPRNRPLRAGRGVASARVALQRLAPASGLGS